MIWFDFLQWFSWLMTCFAMIRMCPPFFIWIFQWLIVFWVDRDLPSEFSSGMNFYFQLKKNVGRVGGMKKLWGLLLLYLCFNLSPINFHFKHKNVFGRVQKKIRCIRNSTLLISDYFITICCFSLRYICLLKVMVPASLNPCQVLGVHYKSIYSIMQRGSTISIPLFTSNFCHWSHYNGFSHS